MKVTTLVITTTVAILIVGFVLIPFIDEDSETEDVWQYDDYRSADDVTSVSGALELVTVGSSQYVHANALGEGTITYSDSTETVTVVKADLDMLFIMGQSNGEYLTQYADPESVIPVPELGTAYYYGTDTYPTIKEYDSTECAMRSMFDSDGSLKIGDIWSPMASTYYEESGHKAFVVSAAWGGKSITEFTPETGEIWVYSETVLADAIESVDTDYYNLTVENYIWIQGEADEDMVKNEYINRFTAMNTAILSGGLGVDTIDACFISKVREERAPVISDAQIEICETVPDVYMACELADGFTYDNGYRADYSHYTQAGDNLIGAALGEYIAEHYYSDPVRESFYDLAVVIPTIIIVAIIGTIGFTVLRRD